MARELPGLLMRSLSSELGERVYYVAQGRRHWVRNPEWMSANGFQWPDGLEEVPPETLYAFANGSCAPTCDGSDLVLLGNRANATEMREIIGASLSGTGIEFGSGASPFPVPLDCHTLYADAFSYESLCAHLYPGQSLHDLVRPDYLTDLATLQGIADESLDYVIACHVIEHVTSPLTAIRNAYRALRPGGSLVLVVPDMTKTFDRDRAPTPLEHLIEDDRAPSAARNLEHFVEFYKLAFRVEGVDISEFAAARQADGTDIHYHCWTYESFDELVRWTGRNCAPWSRVWSHPTLPGEGDIEFYYVLTK